MRPHWFWKHLKSWMSGPESVQTFSRTTWSTWWRHTKESSFFPIFCSKKMQAPDLWPVFAEVVSKAMPQMRSLMPQSLIVVYTAPAVASPVPFNFSTARSWLIPDPDSKIGRRSTVSSPVKSGNSLPSQWTVRGTSTWKPSFTLLARLERWRRLALKIEDLLMFSSLLAPSWQLLWQ